MKTISLRKRFEPPVWFMCLLFIFQTLFVANASAFTSELTGDELVGFLQDSTSIDNPVKRTLAQKISNELIDAGLDFSDVGFSISDDIPGVDTSQYKIYGGSWNATLNGDRTSITTNTAPGQIGININLSGAFSLSGSGAARPLGFIPVGWRHVDISGQGNFHVRLNLNLDASFSKNFENAYVVLGQKASATNNGPLSGDIDVSIDVDVATTSDILTGVVIEEFIERVIRPKMIEGTKAALQANLITKNTEIRALLPFQYRIPALQEMVAQISDDTRRSKIEANLRDLLKKPLVGNIVSTHFQELAFYILTDDHEALLNLACDFTQLLHANMTLPALYSNASGSCVVADITTPEQGLSRFFADASCSLEVAYKPTTYASYCSEVLSGTIPNEFLQALVDEGTFHSQPNSILGNAGSWSPDLQQPNDPTPDQASQAWTLAHGTHFAVTTEPLSGKTIPFMKRVQYRETLKKIPERTAVYRGCLQTGRDDAANDCLAWGYAGFDSLSTIFPRDFAGYVNSEPQIGDIAAFYGCTQSTYEGADATCLNWGISEHDALDSNLRRDFVGYVNPSNPTDTYAIYENCTQYFQGEGNDYYCLKWEIGEKKENDWRSPSHFVGHLYKSDLSACQLEMRAYKKNIDAQNLKPLLAFHGGSWNSRGLAFIGLESQIAHYTEQDFLVFAPFYRLSGNTDGNTECNEATWTEVVADAEAALDWVKTNAQKFGADSSIPAVMGQSAGAHLAGWLVTHRSEDVAAGLLFYPPVDFTELLQKYNGGYFAQNSVNIEPTMDILSNFVGSNARLLSLDSSIVQKNSFASLVSQLGQSAPPVFLLHGLSDDLVPSSQSVTLCNAYGSSTNIKTDNLSSQYTCGSSSQLHLIQQGEHYFENCLSDLNGPCLAGDVASRQTAVDSLQQSREWLSWRQSNLANNNSGAFNTPFTTLTAIKNDDELSESFTLMATVIGNNPTGIVTFMDGEYLLGSVQLINGQASISVLLPASGLRNVTVRYEGDDHHQANTAVSEIFVQDTVAEKVLPIILQYVLEN
ncbi:MAG TPA: Ig-like domain repeat protein [Saprospiraceae bacterium]|nr:Ig-like domain repeat protein [Saprospiraceae bacterium]